MENNNLIELNVICNTIDFGAGYIYYDPIEENLSTLDAEEIMEIEHIIRAALYNFNGDSKNSISIQNLCDVDRDMNIIINDYFEDIAKYDYYDKFLDHTYKNYKPAMLQFLSSEPEVKEINVTIETEDVTEDRKDDVRKFINYDSIKDLLFIQSLLMLYNTYDSPNDELFYTCNYHEYGSKALNTGEINSLKEFDLVPIFFKPFYDNIKKEEYGTSLCDVLTNSNLNQLDCALRLNNK